MPDPIPSSYLDWLPLEIKEYIFHLSKSQCTLEVARCDGHKCSLRTGLSEIKDKWKLGPVFVTSCEKPHIYSSDYDLELGYYTAVMIGKTLESALRRVKHIQLFFSRDHLRM